MQNRVTSFYKRYNTNSQIIDLPVSEIRFAKYQRGINKERAKRIAESFDPDRMRPIEVSFRNGQYWCWDGQHRVEAHKIMDVETIPAIVHHGLTYEREAMLYANQSVDVGPIQYGQKWKALVEADDPEAAEIIRVAKEYGYGIGGSSASKGRIVAVKRLQKVVNTIGIDGFREIMKTISGAWKNEDKAASSDILDGMCLMFKTYGNAPCFDSGRLAGVLAATTPLHIMATSQSYLGRNPGQRIAKVMINLYNKRLHIGRLKDNF